MTTIASDTAQPGVRHFWLGMAAYLVPTFPIAFAWHLVLFEQSYHALGTAPIRLSRSDWLP